jgi:hypothetical protein
MMWYVQYKRMGFVRRTVTEATQEAAIECALRLHGKGYSVLAVGTDAEPRIFGPSDIERLFAQQRQQHPSA